MILFSDNFCRNAQLSKFLRAHVLGYLAAGWQPVKAVRKMEVACSTITRLRDKERYVREELAWGTMSSWCTVLSGPNSLHSSVHPKITTPHCPGQWQGSQGQAQGVRGQSQEGTAHQDKGRGQSPDQAGQDNHQASIGPSTVCCNGGRGYSNDGQEGVLAKYQEHWEVEGAQRKTVGDQYQ